MKIGILITNLGTPETLTTSDIRRFLREFLLDPRVIRLPKPLWWLILNVLILPLRSRRLLETYTKIWTVEGAPLRVISSKIANALEKSFQQKDETVQVVLGMRYGSPSISEALQKLRHTDLILVLPLYPQYSTTTTASTFDVINQELKRWPYTPAITMINHYSENDHYITAIAESITDSWEKNGRGQKLLFSFHGLPKQLIILGDPYEKQCHTTAHLIAKKLQLKEDDWQTVFQSRFGYNEWLQPYCVETLKELPHQQIKSIDIICPGFPAECLETLEEIAIQNKEIFLNAGGERFHYIAALNDRPSHISALTNIVLTHKPPL